MKLKVQNKEAINTPEKKIALSVLTTDLKDAEMIFTQLS